MNGKKLALLAVGAVGAYKLINSPLSRELTRDGMTIEIRIFGGRGRVRLASGGGRPRRRVWDDIFATERALDEVYRTIATEGIASFLRDPNQRLH
jgi:hypothetical protein